MRKIVLYDGVYLWPEPENKAGSQVKTLNTGEELEVLSGKLGDCPYVMAREAKKPFSEGYVCENYLRYKTSEKREILASVASEVYRAFNRGVGRAYDSMYRKHMEAIWCRTMGEKGKNYIEIKAPWNGASISYIVTEASIREKKTLYDNFAWSRVGAHFIHDAFLAKRDECELAPFWAEDPADYAPKIGDIICVSGKPISMSYGDASKSRSYDCICVIMVSFNKKQVVCVGGDINDSFSRMAFFFDQSGKIVHDQRVFAILKNRN